VQPAIDFTHFERLIAQNHPTLKSWPSEKPMSNRAEPIRIAVLDDYQNVALSMADWSGLDKRAAITVFNDHMVDPDAVVARLQSFDIVCVEIDQIGTLRNPVVDEDPSAASG
jgi:hypothetical protein